MLIVMIEFIICSHAFKEYVIADDNRSAVAELHGFIEELPVCRFCCIYEYEVKTGVQIIEDSLRISGNHRYVLS